MGSKLLDIAAYITQFPFELRFNFHLGSIHHQHWVLHPCKIAMIKIRVLHFTSSLDMLSQDQNR
jgi:hypothetical protein